MPDVPGTLSAALADRYELLGVVGRGGMATVYLAHDVRHRRRVAVKVLQPELAASIGTERFLKEIEIAAQLTHPHIVPLYDSGEAGGFLYYVMPMIDGESLRARLARHRRLPLAEAVEITTDVADALHYAHRRGVLHRDVKPENILFSGGHAVVADFGIAKAVSTAADAALTRTGFALGTPGYMSPEQAAGGREVDYRTDVYGLACVLYEMLVGQTPGLWVTEEALRLGRFVDASDDDRGYLDTLPGRVEQALVRALAIAPGQRHRDAAAFADALREAVGRRPHYREHEVEEILHRAAELDAVAPTESGSLTQGAVERVAAEAGIPPARVRDAVRDMVPRSDPGFPPAKPSAWRWFFGEPVTIRIERRIEGEVPAAEFPNIVIEVHRTIGTVGHVSTLGRSLVWSTAPTGQNAGRSIQLTISPRGGRTHIYLAEQLTAAAGGLFGGIMGGGGGAGLAFSFPLAIEALHAPLLAAVFAPVAVLGSWGIARAIFVAISRRRQAELHTLVERIADHITETSRGGALGSGDRGVLPPGS